MDYVLGVDLGTSSLKAILVDKAGNVHNSVSYSYDIIVERDGYSEQNPQEWINALDFCITEISNKLGPKDSIEGISFSGQMHSLVLLDSNGEVLRNSILWNDVRTKQECDYLNTHYKKDMIESSGNIALEGFTLPKLLWLQKHERFTWSKVYKMMLPKDYLLYYLTGEIVTDYSDASGTLLLNLETRKWNHDLCKKLDIPLEILPELVESTACVGLMKPELIKKYNLKNDIKIFAGGSDNACSALGAGVTNNNSAMVSIGTSGVFLTNHVGRYDERDDERDGSYHSFHHVIDRNIYNMGVTLAAGKSLEWFKESFYPKQGYDEMLSSLSDKRETSGLIFTPYIMGERTPHADPHIRGSFIGIDFRHSKEDFLQSVLEGITFSIKESKDLIERSNNKIYDEIISVGGGSKNKRWLQLQADIFGSRIKTLEVDEGPAFGAAILAAVGAGWYDDPLVCANKFVEYKEHYSPNLKVMEEYEALYRVYKDVYSSTKTISYDLAFFRKE